MRNGNTHEDLNQCGEMTNEQPAKQEDYKNMQKSLKRLQTDAE